MKPGQNLSCLKAASALILLLAWIGMHLSHKLIGIFKHYIIRITTDAGSIKRSETLGQAFNHIAIVVITLISGM